MPVSGLVLSLSEGAAGDTALDALRSRPELTLGPRSGNRVSAALDTRDVHESRDVHDWLASQPGVQFVDVVYVNFEDL